MSLSKLKIFLIYFVCLIFILPTLAHAEDKNLSNQFITLVNPVRIATYTKDSVGSLASEYSEISKRNLPATWLVTNDVLDNPQMIASLIHMDQKQDLGILLEVTPNFAKNSKVIYNKTDSWHRSNSLFLIGYTQEDRKKLIDAVFEHFKSIFGYYPKSVGAWWVDSFSLSYMKDKYQITSILDVSDQFERDGYGIWGQYWSTPFYPNKFHAGIPASNTKNKIGVVTIQWAPRDPFSGYDDSLYSSQDYSSLGLPNDYYEELIRLYALKHQNQFGQITLGLEGDLGAESYHGLYSEQMDIINRLSFQEKITVTNMKDFSDWYMKTFPDISPSHVIETDDLLGQGIKSIWYQSPYYRIGLTYDNKNQTLKVIDLRTYQDNFQEPYYLTPDTQLNLYINIPSLVDQKSDSKTVWEIPAKGIFLTEGNNHRFSLKVDNYPLLTFEENKITLSNVEIPSAIKGSSLLEIKKQPQAQEISITQHWLNPIEGMNFRDLPPQFFYLLNSYNLSKPKTIKVLSVTIFALGIGLFIVIKFKIYRKKLFKMLSIIFLSGTCLLIISQTRIYSVSQAETDAILHLKALDKGKVVVYDQTCLKCIWHSNYMPAVFANIRGYVSQISKKPIVYNRSIFVAIDRPTGKKQLDNLDAKYIYLAKYENYVETLPFSPGDYNVELIYENANAQIWRIKDK